MNDSNNPREAIKSYLDARAASDPLFAASYAKPQKNIDECFNYILSEARKRGTSVCMTDDEVFGLAVHYYDEDDIKVAPAPANYRAKTSSKPTPTVELTEEEKEKAREEAIRLYRQNCVEEMMKKEKAARAKHKPASESAATSLFDML